MQRIYTSSEILAEKDLPHGKKTEGVKVPTDYDMDRDEIEEQLSDYGCYECKTVRFLCQCETTCPNHDCGRPRFHILVVQNDYLEFVWRCEVCDDFSDDYKK